MKYLIRLQQFLYFFAFLLWGQAVVGYALTGSFGNRFIGAAAISGTALVTLVLSFIYPKSITYLSILYAALISIAIIVLFKII